MRCVVIGDVGLDVVENGAERHAFVGFAGTVVRAILAAGVAPSELTFCHPKLGDDDAAQLLRMILETSGVLNIEMPTPHHKRRATLVRKYRREDGEWRMYRRGDVPPTLSQVRADVSSMETVIDRFGGVGPLIALSDFGRLPFAPRMRPDYGSRLMVSSKSPTWAAIRSRLFFASVHDLGLSIGRRTELVRIVKDLAARGGAASVAVSDGASGLVVHSGDRLLSFPATPVNCELTAGAGDWLFGTLIGAVSLGGALEDAFGAAVRAASETCRVAAVGGRADSLAVRLDASSGRSK